MLNNFKKAIIKSDLIGLPVALNFDKKGSYYQTFFGGIGSIVLITFSIYYSSNGIFKILNHGEDQNL